MNIEQLQSQWSDYQPTIETKHKQDAKMLALGFMEMEQKVKERTLLGSLAFGLLAMSLMAFVYLLQTMQAPLTAMLAVVLWIVVLVINLLRLWHIKASQPSMYGAVNDHLQEKGAWVDKEITFYLSLWKWVTLPLGVGVVLLVASFQAQGLTTVLLFVVAYTLLAWKGHQNCKKQVQTELLPVQTLIQKAQSTS